MSELLEILKRPWPWYVSGPLLGLIVPALLLTGNKVFGISSSLRHTCAACFPAKVEFLKYDWRKEAWNLFFAAGIVIGGFLGVLLLPNDFASNLSARTLQDLKTLGIEGTSGLVPGDVFNWKSLFSLRGFFFIVAGGFFVGFGTRWAGGCTSGHGLAGTAMLQWPSYVALLSFFAGGIFYTFFLLPLLAKT